MERLQKVIAKAGIASRRKAEELIAAGKVKVNGKVVKEMGIQVSSSDEIRVNNQLIQTENKVYYLLNKPAKTLSTVSDNHDRPTVMDCFEGIKERIFPVGRLDYETTGILLMTNDGDFAQKMMHPRSHMQKTYHVVVEGVFTDEMAKILTNGIIIEGKKTLPAIVEIVARSKKRNRSELNITIFEGRNREVRKMMEYFDCQVRHLNRIAYGFLELGNLRQGEYRKLRSYEVRKLIPIAEKK
ncbi:MAG: rRNA pseudouridine synthase [Solobacterium sp.]|nr:rRNA pseudouridine synthase [Solobacterium sp.]